MSSIIIISNTFSSSFVFRYDYIEFLRKNDVLGCVVSTADDRNYVNEIDLETYNGICFKLKNLGQIFRTLKKAKVIHSFTHIGNVLGFLLSLIMGKPQIATITGRGRIYQNKGLKNRVFRVILNKMYLYIANSKGILIVQNKTDLSFFKQVIGNDKKLLITAGSGISYAEYEKLFSPIQINKKKLILGFMSRALVEKGVHEFYDAALVHSTKNIRFRHVGHAGIGKFGPAEIYETAASFNVEYLPFTNKAFDQIKSMDIIVIPSTYLEGVPRLMIEALCAGKIVIARKTSGIMDYEGVFPNLIIYESDLISAIEICLHNINRIAKCVDTNKAFSVFDARKVLKVYKVAYSHVCK